MKNIFVMWSGGVDSTFLIYHLLKQGHNVSAGYINIQNNYIMAARELAAIKEMEFHFRHQFGNKFTFLNELSRINLLCVSDNLILQQAIVWPTVLTCISKTIDEVAIGYVMNDDALSYLDEIRNIFKAYSGLMTKEIPVTFPIIKYKKHTIWEELPIEFKNNVVWCEDVDVNKCGNCTSCIRSLDAGILNPYDVKKFMWYKGQSYGPPIACEKKEYIPEQIQLNLPFDNFEVTVEVKVAL